MTRGDWCIPHPSLGDDKLIVIQHQHQLQSLLLTTMLLSSCCDRGLTDNVCDVVFVLTPALSLLGAEKVIQFTPWAEVRRQTRGIPTIKHGKYPSLAQESR